jgi:hypothetical protein
MLRIKFIPYERLKEEKFKKILKDLAGNTIILVDAKLDAKEEAALIAETMRTVSEKFSGIELSSIEINSKDNDGFYARFKNSLVERIIGKKRGMTVLGPAKIVQKIKKNPEELLLYM